MFKMQAGKHPQMTLTCHTVAMDVTAYVVSCKELVLGIGQGTLVHLEKEDAIEVKLLKDLTDQCYVS